MRRTLATLVAVLALALVVAAPAFAVNGSGGAGQDYGRHHAAMAAEMSGFTGTMNPGVHHQGFSNWDPSMAMP